MISINENLRIKRLDTRNLTFEIREEIEESKLEKHGDKPIFTKTGNKKMVWKQQGYFPNLKSCVKKIDEICFDEEFNLFKKFIDEYDFKVEDDSKIKKNWGYKNYLINSNGDYGGYILSEKYISQKGKTKGQEIISTINYPSRLKYALEYIVELEFDKVDNTSALSMEATMHILTTIKEDIERELKEVKL